MSGPPEARRHLGSCQWGRVRVKEGRGYACGQGALRRGLESGLEGGMWVGGSGCFYSLWVVCHIQTI